MLFQRVATICTLIAFAVHAAVGCCLHHAHAWEFGACSPRACGGDNHAHSHDGPSHSDTGGEAAEHDKSEHAPQDPAQCDEGRCSYLQSDAVVFLAARSLAADVCVIVPEAHHDSGSDEWMRDQGVPFASESALKVRALLQLWRL